MQAIKAHFLAGVGGRAQDLMLKENVRYKNISITCLHICKNVHLYMYRKKLGESTMYYTIQGYCFGDQI